ncbi:hypothetical protein BSLG_005972 [Batrachochytrium salamandrivorans]|nr:hypothetical protein BSLG_005972 [Batrachochytrium salamandrivorans]
MDPPFKGMLKGFEGFSKALEDRTREQRVADGEEKGDDDDEVEVEDEGNYLNDDVSDDEDDLETLARNAAEYRTTTHSGEKGEDDVADDESDDNWSVDGMMMEDVYFTTYLDEVNVFVQFEALMTRLVQTGRAAILDTELTAEQKEQVRSILSTASVTGSKSTVAEAASSQ